MLQTRSEWGKYVMDTCPELAETLKEMNQLFGAKVIKMEHEDPNACWGEELEWGTDNAITPYFPLESKQSDNKAPVKKYPVKKRSRK